MNGQGINTIAGFGDLNALKTASTPSRVLGRYGSSPLCFRFWCWQGWLYWSGLSLASALRAGPKRRPNQQPQYGICVCLNCSRDRGTANIQYTPRNNLPSPWKPPTFTNRYGAL